MRLGKIQINQATFELIEAAGKAVNEGGKGALVVSFILKFLMNFSMNSLVN